MTGRVEPGGDDLARRPETERDVLGGAGGGRISARLHPVEPATRDRRCGIVVLHVAIRGHVPRLPDGRRGERPRRGEGVTSELRPVVVDELEHLSRLARARGRPARRGRAVSDDRRSCRGEARRARQRGNCDREPERESEPRPPTCRRTVRAGVLRPPALLSHVCVRSPPGRGATLQQPPASFQQGRAPSAALATLVIVLRRTRGRLRAFGRTARCTSCPSLGHSDRVPVLPTG